MKNTILIDTITKLAGEVKRLEDEKKATGGALLP
jgi:hypothetical protein